jgi:hypothetical protein
MKEKKYASIPSKGKILAGGNFKALTSHFEKELGKK